MVWAEATEKLRRKTGQPRQKAEKAATARLSASRLSLAPGRVSTPTYKRGLRGSAADSSGAEPAAPVPALWPRPIPRPSSAFQCRLHGSMRPCVEPAAPTAPLASRAGVAAATLVAATAAAAARAPPAGSSAAPEIAVSPPSGVCASLAACERNSAMKIHADLTESWPPREPGQNGKRVTGGAQQERAGAITAGTAHVRLHRSELCVSSPELMLELPLRRARAGRHQ